MTDALATLRRELPWLRRLAVTLAHGDSDEAEDLVQETLHTAWQRPPVLGELPTPRGWFATVMRNHLRMSRRADARRQRRHDASAPPAAAEDPTAELARIELVGHLVAALRSLPEIDQRIITLRFFDELDASAIGARLSMPPATVRSRLHRALARLSEGLDAHYGDRRSWAVVLGVTPNPTPATPIGSLAVMHTATKIGIAVAVIAAASITWAVARDTTPAPTTFSIPASAVPADSAVLPAHRPADRDVAGAWEARRDNARAHLRARIPRRAPSRAAAREDAASVEAAEAAAKAALHEAFFDCIEDSERQIDGSITVRARLVGSAEVGTIIESVEPIGAPLDVELLECATQSSYAFVGPAPRTPIEITTTVAFLGAQPRGVDDDAWRREMFDAVITAHLAELRACDAEAPNASGALHLDFEFGDGPAPLAVHGGRSEVDPAIVDCAVDVAGTWMFPRRFTGRTMASDHMLPLDAAVDGSDRASDD